MKVFICILVFMTIIGQGKTLMYRFTLTRTQVMPLGEILNTLISAAPPNAECAADAADRPCVRFNGALINNYPPDWPCPCHADGSAGGAVDGQGQPSASNPYAGQFVEDIVVEGFTNPVGMSFTDNGLLFVCTKEVQKKQSFTF